jgi:hypothetical protein
MKPGRLSPDALLFPVLGVRATCPVRRRPKTAPQLQAPPPAAAAIAEHIDCPKRGAVCTRARVHACVRACVSRGLSMSVCVCVCECVRQLSALTLSLTPSCLHHVPHACYVSSLDLNPNHSTFSSCLALRRISAMSCLNAGSCIICIRSPRSASIDACSFP